MLFAPTSLATFSSARHTSRSCGVRSQSPNMLRPPSPDSMRRFSSASVRILPDTSTFHGAKAMPGILLEKRHVYQHDMRTFVDDHRQNVALNIAHENVPLALVDRKRRLARHASVVVRLRHDPRRGV